MYNIEIGDNVLIATIIIVLALIYYFKRKFDSFNLHNILMFKSDIQCTYKESQKQYKKSLENFDILADDETVFVNNILKFVIAIKKHIDSG